jgi:hypothetical protein
MPASTAARPATTWDCGLAQAPSCEPRGREPKYSSVSARGTRSTGPTTITWRCMAIQGKSRLAYGFSASSSPLRDA